MRRTEERDEELAAVFRAARVEPAPEERRRLLAAAEPILAEHAARRHAGPVAGWLGRLRAILQPRPALAVGLAAAIVAVIVVTFRMPPARETRSAAVATWQEHERSGSAPFPLVSAGFGRAY
jgi:hypothetical protein